MGQLSSEYTEEFIEANFDYPDLDQVEEDPALISQSKELLTETLVFKSGTIPVSFLVRAIDPHLYRIGKKGFLGEDAGDLSNDDEEQPHEEMEEKVEEQDIREEEVSEKVSVLFREPEKWIKMGDFDSEQEATVAVNELIREVKKLNIRSEGIHILEHILLRPDLKDVNHGILIYNEDWKPFLRSAKQFSFEERQKALKEIQIHLYEFSNYSVEVTPEKDFEVHFTTPDGQYEFVSIHPNESVEYTHEQMEKLFAFISDRQSIVSFYKKIGLYVRNTITDRIITEDFFSYRISVILPGWTARFSNKEFRVIVEDTIHEQRPANVALNCYWLSPPNLSRFESIYYAWMEEKRKNKFDQEKLQNLNNKLSELLMEFKDSCEE
jgi:hypothetical protein